MFFINAWTWGYEDILKAIARAFGSKVSLYTTSRIDTFLFTNDIAVVSRFTSTVINTQCILIFAVTHSCSQFLLKMLRALDSTHVNALTAVDMSVLKARDRVHQLPLQTRT